MPSPTADVVVVAAGSSSRMEGVDKVTAPIAGRPLLAWTLEPFERGGRIDRIVVVTAAERVEELRAAPWLPDRSVVVAGGERRQDSVAAGVAALERAGAPGERVVLVHDAARPAVGAPVIGRVIDATAEHGAAIPAVPVVETLKRVTDGRIDGTVDRGGLWAAQTPQGVRLGLLRGAYARFPPGGPDVFTDEAALLEACTIPVHVVPGQPDNLKVTHPADLGRAASALGADAVRIGFGEDAHPFGPGAPLALGGIEVPGAPRLHGHSDGDVVLHAVAEALLGAAGLGDLGRLHPADATTPRGIASAELLGDVAARVREAGFGVTGLDVTIVGARPRLGDRLDAIRDRIAQLHGAATVRGERQGVHGQPVGRRGRRPLDLRARRRHPPGRPMTIRLRDTLSGDLKPLEPLEPGHVRVYSCGPTVYGPAHIGNFRSFLFADLLVRYLRYRGLRVTWVMNLTDIDDKIIRGAAAEGISHEALADRYAERFLADADALAMTRPDALPRATRHIPEIADLVATLQAKGHAYATEDGSIFFRIASWPAYGRLARLDPEAMRVGERVEADEYGKDDVRDFALWKGPKPGEPSWDTVVGPGRPGWHVECSAMSMAQLGPSFDIHTGGVDLIFPHHEDEIAQSEAATGAPFVRTWMHCAHLRMGGEKMAKSVGNIARVADLVASGVAPRALRFALISVHYRASLNYSDESLTAAAAAVERIDAVIAALDGYREDRPDDPELPVVLDRARAGFEAGLDDDLNVSEALAALFDGIRDLNRRIDARTLSTADAARATVLIRDLDAVLGVAAPAASGLDPDLEAMLEARVAARAARDWAESDRLRDALLARGVAVEDTRDGQRWRLVVATGG